jgi:hypothetical protein
VNASVVGVADMLGTVTGGLVTDIVTASVCVPPVEAIEIVPLQVVPAASPD